MSSWSSSKSRNMSSSSSESRNFSDQEIDQFIHVANKAADVAEEIISKYYISNLQQRPPRMPQTPRAEIDKKAEEAMVITILTNFPSHAVYGEESGWWDHTRLNPSLDEETRWRDIGSFSRNRACLQNPSFVWVLDPIYGNKGEHTGASSSFSFSTMISLLYNGKPLLGCLDQSQLISQCFHKLINQCFHKLRWMGFKGKPTTLNEDPIHTKACEDISMACANLKPPYLGKHASYAFNCLAHKVNDAWFDTSFTAFGELASGQMHVVVDSDLSPYNCLALLPIVEGAGGIITDWCGRELCWSPWNGNERRKGTGFRVVAAGDRKTYEQAIDSLWP